MTDRIRGRQDSGLRTDADIHDHTIAIGHPIGRRQERLERIARYSSHVRRDTDSVLRWQIMQTEKSTCL